MTKTKTGWFSRLFGRKEEKDVDNGAQKEEKAVDNGTQKEEIDTIESGDWVEIVTPRRNFIKNKKYKVFNDWYTSYEMKSILAVEDEDGCKWAIKLLKDFKIKFLKVDPPPPEKIHSYGREYILAPPKPRVWSAGEWASHSEYGIGVVYEVGYDTVSVFFFEIMKCDILSPSELTYIPN